MKFDITHLDKNTVIRTLFAHAAPIGLGEAEYDTRKDRQENVDGLTDEDCEVILYPFKRMKSGYKKLLDYHKGKPMKLIFEKKPNGRILVDTDDYDARNGRYRFFEALLNAFPLDEILITKKGYGHYTFVGHPKELERSKKQVKMFRDIIKNSIKAENAEGSHWCIDVENCEYKPPILRIV